MNREDAWSIVTEFTESETLRRHMLAVEAAMRHYAPKYDGNLMCGALLAYSMILIMKNTPMLL